MITRRLTRLTANIFTGAALSVALTAAVLTVPSQALAADDDDEPSFDTKILRGILEGIGLERTEKTINYQERAPLVIPPSRTLPPPERSDAVIANNPAWPKDPDVLRAKEEAARERRAFTTADDALRNDARPLRPDELTPGPKPRGKVARTTQQAGSSSGVGDQGNQRLTSSQLGNSGGLFGKMFSKSDDETARFTGEPPRTALTAPPPGYQTPSPDQPYGVTERSKAPKATNYMLEHGTELPK